MKRVIFKREKETGLNKTKYPDDIEFFSRVESDGDGNLIADYTGEMDLTLYVEPVVKSTYTKNNFIAMIPKEKIRLIQAATSTNDDINVWVFNVPMMDVINLNRLPAWFTAGLQAMVTEGIFTQAQINSFLEL